MVLKWINRLGKVAYVIKKIFKLISSLLNYFNLPNVYEDWHPWDVMGPFHSGKLWWAGLILHWWALIDKRVQVQSAGPGTRKSVLGLHLRLRGWICIHWNLLSIIIKGLILFRTDYGLPLNNKLFKPQLHIITNFSSNAHLAYTIRPIGHRCLGNF